MKKFEIVKNRWIKKLDLEKESEYGATTTTHILAAVKISSITHIFAFSLESGYFKYHIGIGTENAAALEFEYDISEEREFRDDLSFFEDLLYNQ